MSFNADKGKCRSFSCYYFIIILFILRWERNIRQERILFLWAGNSIFSMWVKSEKKIRHCINCYFSSETTLCNPPNVFCTDTDRPTLQTTDRCMLSIVSLVLQEHCQEPRSTDLYRRPSKKQTGFPAHELTNTRCTELKTIFIECIIHVL